MATKSEIAQEEIDKRKQAHVAEPDAKFVSTNDIITSWFLEATQVDIGIMAFNARKAAGVEGTALGWPPRLPTKTTV